MKKEIMERECQITSDASLDLATVYERDACRCEHLQRWLPHLLDTTALANESLDTYLVENAVHALHLQSNMGATSSVLYGEEQRRSSSLWHTTGIVDSYVPNRLPSINKHYSSKRVKVEKKEPVVKSEVPPSAVVSTWPSDVKSHSGPPSVVNNTVAAGATAIAINPASLVSSLAPQPIKSEHPSTIASFEIPEERFQQLRRAENQILLQRRGIFTKRDKRKTTKKIKRNETPVKPTVIINEKSAFVIHSDAWEEEAARARDKVELWMHHFRQCRREYWRSLNHETSQASLMFGAFDNHAPKPQCQECSTRHLTGDDVMTCLECGFVGCAPHSLSPKSNQHMILHMLTSNHKFAATCGKRNSIYCFGCGDIAYHQVFDCERERIDLEHSLPNWAWPENTIQRSFDAFQFVSSQDHGIVWRGMVATYPTMVPSHHLAAAKLVLQRFRFRRDPVISAPVGLYNLGNTCFMNGILQCLIHCPPLQKHFLQDIRHDHRSCCLFRNNPKMNDALSSSTKIPGCLACELDLLFLQYFGSTIGLDVVEQLNGSSVAEEDKGMPLIPSTLLTEAWKQPEMDHLKGYEQRDAHEFLQAFLDIVAKNSKSYEKTLRDNLAAKKLGVDDSKASASVDIVKDLFEGTLRSVSICEDCGCKRSLQEPFLNVSLPLSEDSVLKFTSRKMNIQHCLKHFTAPERLGDQIECPSCHRKTPTKKQQTFSRLPKVLCLHLKRFDAAKNKKINDFVSFPAFGLDMGALLPHWREVILDDGDEELDEAAYPEVLYDLYGTVNHVGTLNQGHYVSNVKVGDQWYHCNDAHISTSEESEVLKSEGAYMMFYLRR